MGFGVARRANAEVGVSLAGQGHQFTGVDQLTLWHFIVAVATQGQDVLHPHVHKFIEKLFQFRAGVTHAGQMGQDLDANFLFDVLRHRYGMCCAIATVLWRDPPPAP